MKEFELLPVGGVRLCRVREVGAVVSLGNGGAVGGACIIGWTDLIRMGFQIK